MPIPRGGSSTPSDGNGDGSTSTSLTVIVGSEQECIASPADLNNDCAVDYDEAQFYTFYTGLTPQQKAIVDADQRRFFTYLKGNGFSVDAENFLIEAINAIRDGGEVDLVLQIIYDNTFINTKTECIHNKMKNNPNNIYSKMLNNFTNLTNKNLKFSINNTIGSDWGITNGNPQIQNDYNITLNLTLIENNGSNLMKFVTLCHELIHAYMFSELEGLGLITFDPTGSPILNVNCPSSNTNLNTQNINDRFISLMCAMNNAGTISPNWTHDLFNSNVFNVQDYRQELENFILNDYDWSSENTSFITSAQTTFGSNWKSEVSRAISWIGLEGSLEYNNYISNYNTSPSKFLFINNIRNSIANTNNNCP